MTRKKVRSKIHGYITWLALVVAAALAVGLVSMVALWPQDAKAAEAPPAFITKWGNSTDGDGQFSNPQGVATDSSGNVYVADTWNHRIQKFDPNGGFITKWGSSGTGNTGSLAIPRGWLLTPPATSMWPTRTTTASRSSGTLPLLLRRRRDALDGGDRR